MPSLWKKLCIVATILLVISLILDGSLWYQLNTTRMQLNETTAQLNAIKPGADRFIAERDQILSSYTDLRRQINLRLGIGQDGQHFITPDEPEISTKVQEITGGYSEEELWQDFARLFRWINANISYSLDCPTPLLPESVNGTLEWGKGFWRMPVETMRDGAGDCEDTALLLASMLLNYNQRKFAVWIVGARNSGPNARAHIAVAIPSKNNQLVIFDMAAHYSSTAPRFYSEFPTVDGLGSLDVPLAVEYWLNHLEGEVPDAQMYVAFSENFYKEFSSNQEFIEWASKLST
ncbi:transglutaminase-like domain-containing protein [Chloroflexota bacterium]